VTEGKNRLDFEISKDFVAYLDSFLLLQPFRKQSVAIFSIQTKCNFFSSSNLTIIAYFVA
jgi:hypothetical protein